MKDILNKATRIIAFTLCATTLFFFLSSVCERKTYDGAWNYMGKMNEFYSLEENTLDYIAVGSSHMYCTLNPLEVWNKSGAAGFVLATQQQPLQASYHYIKEAFKTQSPKYVILEGYMIYGESTYDSAVLYDAIDPLKFSFNKVQMINNLVEYEDRPNYYFNILKYHSRWNTVTANEINRILEQPQDIYKGFVALDGNYSGYNLIPDYDNTNDIELSEFNTQVLNDIYELVTDNGAALILMFGPYDTNSVELCEKIKAEIKWAEEKGITVLDYCEMLNDINIDPTNDYYDAGHLDISGAKKVSIHFASYLKENKLKKNNRITHDQWQMDYNTYSENFSNEIYS